MTLVWGALIAIIWSCCCYSPSKNPNTNWGFKSFRNAQWDSRLWKVSKGTNWTLKKLGFMKVEKLRGQTDGCAPNLMEIQKAFKLSQYGHHEEEGTVLSLFRKRMVVALSSGFTKE